jgi:predicted transcriptional regulator
LFPRSCVLCGIIKECGRGFCGFCCCDDTVTLFYEHELPIDDLYMGRNMASSIVRATKLNAKLQMSPIVYANENRLTKLRQNNGLDFINGSKRGRLEIIAEILCHCNQQKTKTNIMYKTNLNYTQVKKHLKHLTSQGLLKANKNKYATTQKGIRFL